MDIDELINYLFTPLAQVGLIIGLAEVIKRFGVKASFIPLVDLILGLFSGVCVYGVGCGYGILKGSLIGLSLGLGACGLFSGFKNTIL